MKRTIWICILLLCTGIPKVQAQNDPVLAGMILLYTEKAEKELKNQEKVMLMQTTGHLWTKEEVEATTDLQREFNNYLNSFRSIVCYAAQIYGFYHEIARLTDNISFSLPSQRDDINSGNCLAYAVFWNSMRSCSWRAVISSIWSSLAKNWAIRSSLFLMCMHSMARRTILIVEKERLPRPIDVFGPKRFSNTRVRHPMVATSCI